jgi:hypothetical protein
MTPEPIELSYALFLLPPGRIAFRRWRWELWNGSQLLAAGWRTGVLHAQQALRGHAIRYAHRRHGLHVLRPEAAIAPEGQWGGQRVAVRSGEFCVVLTPRAATEWPDRSRTAA